MHKLIFRFSELGRIGAGRIRARRLALLGGARVSPKCTLGPRVRIDRAWTVTLGLRSTFESDVWIKVVSDSARVHIGDHTFIGRATEIDVSRQVLIGAHVLIAPGVFISDHNHKIEAGRLIDSQGCMAAPVTIGDDVWLGTGSIILPGVTIGTGAVVGAGAVVTRDVAPNSIVVGIPAREIGLRP